MPKRPAPDSAVSKTRLVRVASVIASLLVILLAVQPAMAADQRSNPRQDTRYRLQPGVFVYGTSWVAPLAELFGELYIGDGSFVAGNSIVRAAPTHQVTIGSNTSVQDNVIVRALEDNVTIGDGTTITHHAVVRNSQIGGNAYVGYYARVTDSQIGDGAIVWHGARVEGVSLPANAYVAAGQVITSQARADALPKVATPSKTYVARRLESNRAFARGYIKLYESEGYDAVIGVGPNPETQILPQSTEPSIANGVELQEFARVVGDVRIGQDSSVGQRTVIRADEGSPIVIGSDADIDDRVTFHGIEDTEVRIGDGLTVDDDAVIHGPLDIGDNVTVGEHAVVFNATVGDNVRVGEEAIISPPPGSDAEIVIPANSVVPEGAVITGPKDMGKLRQGGSTGNNGEDQDDVPGDLPETGAGGMVMGGAATAGAAAAHTVGSAERR